MFLNDLPTTLQPTYQNNLQATTPVHPGQPAWPVVGEHATGFLGIVARRKIPAWLNFVFCCLGERLIQLGLRMKGEVAAGPVVVQVR